MLISNKRLVWLLIVLIILLSACGGAKKPDEVVTWPHWFASDQRDAIADICLDAENNVIAVVSTKGSLYDNKNLGNYDIVISKFDSLGKRLWSKALATKASDIVTSVVCDVSGDYYLAGRSNGDIFGIKNHGAYDGFVAKYDKNGSLKWKHLFATAKDDNVADLFLDKTGNLLLAGDSGADTISTSNGGEKKRWFVGKFDSSGKQVWLTVADKSQIQSTQAITVWQQNVIVARKIEKAAKKDTDLLVLRAKNGQQFWGIELGNKDYQSAVSTDIYSDKQGNLYWLGYKTDKTAKAGKGKEDIFLIIYSNDTSHKKVLSLGGVGSDYSSRVLADTAGNIFLTGHSNSELYGHKSQEIDAFVFKLNSVGKMIAQKWFSSKKDDLARALAIDGSRIFFAGDSYGDLLNHKNSGNRDSFIQQFVFEK